MKNGLTKKDLFFYNREKTQVGNAKKIIVKDIPFRRFMIKSDGKISVKNKKEVDISSDDIVKLDLTNNDRYYTIIIDEQFLSQGFVIESEGNYIIGVCF